MDGWDNFFVAQAGAAVAFAGLVLVSISINLDRIIKMPGLTGRSAEPLVTLFTLFVASGFFLIPGQPLWLYGLELLILAIAFAIVIGFVLRNQSAATLAAEGQSAVPRSSLRLRQMLCAVTAGFLIAAGIVTILGSERGIYLTVPAMIAGFLLSFTDAWVLLIEIDR